MREGRTLTRTLRIESRQHSLFGMDLGEGIPRAALLFGLCVALVWWVILYLIVGPPQKATAFLYIAPPALLATYGWSEGKANPRRRRVTEWVLAARWVRTGHRPVIALGRREVRAGESAPAIARLGARLAAADAEASAKFGRNLQAKAARQAARRPAATPGRVRLGGRVEVTSTRAAMTPRPAKLSPLPRKKVTP